MVRDRRVDDRRSYALRTTPAGRRAVKRLSVAIHRLNSEFLAPLLPGEDGRLVMLLQLVVLPHFDPPPPADLAQLIGFLMAHAYLRLEVRGDAKLAPFGLTVRTFVSLATLARRAPCSQQDLADRLEIKPAATVELIDELERLETVRRSRNPSDRRSYALVLTESGGQLLGEAKAALTAAANKFMAPLDDTQRAELAVLLAKLAGMDVAALDWLPPIPAVGP